YFIFGNFFFQAEVGIRDFHVTGVQTCALPIYTILGQKPRKRRFSAERPPRQRPNSPRRTAARPTSSVRPRSATTARSRRRPCRDGSAAAAGWPPSAPPPDCPPSALPDRPAAPSAHRWASPPKPPPPGRAAPRTAPSAR